MRRCVILMLAAALVGWAANFEELAQKATDAFKRNDLPVAIDLYRAALAENPKSEQVWWYFANCLYSAQRFPEAVEAFHSLLAINPQRAPAWGLGGLSEMQTGDFAAALADINRGLALNEGISPQLKDAFLTNKALLLSRTGEFDQSLRILGNFVSGGANPALLQALGIATLRRAILPAEIPSAESDLVTRAGKATFLRLSGGGDAEAAFRQLCVDFPAARNVHYALGYFLLPHDAAGAAAEFKKELAVNPNNADAAIMLGWDVFLTGDASAANTFAERGIKNSTTPSSDQQYVMGRILFALGKAESAVPFLESAAKLDPENLEDHVALANAYPLVGRFADAQRERQLSLRLKSGAAVI